MKIMFICNISLYVNGPSVHLLEDIMKQCLLDGHSLVIAMKDTGEHTRNIDEEIIDSHRAEVVTVPFQNVAKKNLVGRYKQDATYANKIAKVYKNITEIDVVFLQSCNTSAFHVININKYLKSVPIVYNVQDMFPENTCAVGALKKNSVKFKLLKKIQAYSYKKAKRIIAISYDMQRCLQSYKETTDKIHVIYNWAYENKSGEIKNDHFRQDYLKISDEAYLVLYAGNIGVAQNVEMIVQTAARLKEYKDIIFVIVGDGARHEKIKNMINQMDLTNVFLVGAVKQENSLDLYNSADINLIPLRENMINFALPSKTARCLFSDSIVITCFDDSSVIVQQLRDETDVVNISPDDFNALAQVILKYYSKELNYNHEKSVGFAKRYFDRENNVHQYCNILYDAVKDSHNSP